MWKLILASTKMLYRDRQNLFWALVFPLIFAVVFGWLNSGGGPQIEIAVVAEAPSPVSRALVSSLGEVDAFIISEERSESVARSRIAEGDADVAALVPAGTVATTKPASVSVLYGQGGMGTNELALSAIRQVLDRVNLEIAGVKSPALTLRPEPVSRRAVTNYDFVLPGFAAMGVMNFAISGVAATMASYREKRILKRIRATPLSPSRFLAAEIMVRVALSVVQVGVILAVGVYWFGANIYSNVLWLFVLAALGNVVFLNIGFAVAGRSSTVDAANGMANAIALPMMFLSGGFFPVDVLPGLLQQVVRYLRLTPLVEAMRKVANEGLSIVDTGPQLALLGAWVVVSFLVAGRTFRFSAA